MKIKIIQAAGEVLGNTGVLGTILPILPTQVEWAISHIDEEWDGEVVFTDGRRIYQTLPADHIMRNLSQYKWMIQFRLDNELSFLDKSKQFAIQAHRNVNHYYDNKPYDFHLQMVVDVAMENIELIPKEDRENVLAALWSHDTIEDCRLTYNDVKVATNETVADIVYALTTEKGKNRKERAGIKYYFGINAVQHAPFAKYCDRIANVKYSKETGSSMFNVYKKEHDFFCKHILQISELTNKLNQLFEL